MARSGRSRRPARADAGAGAGPGPEAGPTFGELLEAAGLVEQTARATRHVIDQSNAAALAHAGRTGAVVSCLDCTAPKACCTLTTSAYLHEAIPIAARLRREGRDTPALRDALRAAAHRMETTPASRYQAPCVFLDDGERCTVYEERPSVCGTHLVSSPAAACSDPTVASIVKLVGTLQDRAPPEIDAQLTMRAGLRPLDRSYRGALPRMVLLCLEAWPRRDYVSFLGERVLAAAHRFAAATR